MDKKGIILLGEKIMNELEKYKQGLDFYFEDEDIVAIKNNALIECGIYNSIDPLDSEKRYNQLKKMLGHVGENVLIERNFNCDNGKNISIGNNFLGNYNLTILDINKVNIGNNVLIGPNTTITSVAHPIDPKGRRECLCTSNPINIGDDVWIGANVTILPGVTIGNNVVIGAGAVVNKDILDNSLVVGVPAKVIKKIENNVEED